MLLSNVILKCKMSKNFSQLPGKPVPNLVKFISLYKLYNLFTTVTFDCTV